MAKDHEDTTEGATHCFQDEYGNWHSYTFGPSGGGVDGKKVSLEGGQSRDDRSRSFTSLSSFGSELTMVVHTPSKHRSRKRSRYTQQDSAGGSAISGEGREPSADGFSQNAMAGSLAGESRVSAGGPAGGSAGGGNAGGGVQRSYVTNDTPPPHAR